jgi:hypothetical protein
MGPIDMSNEKLAALMADIQAIGEQKKLEKTASFWSRVKGGMKLSGPARDALRVAGFGGLLGGGATVAAHTVGHGIQGVESATDYRTSKKRLKGYAPDLFKGRNNKKTTLTYLNTLNRLAPTLARDPVVSSTFVRRMKEMPETGLGMAKELSSAEARIQDVRGSKISRTVPGLLQFVNIPGTD